MGLGLLCGVTGQMLRAVAGLRKEEGVGALPPDPNGTAPAGKPFSGVQFGMSLVLGGVAGMLGALTLWDEMRTLNKDVVLGLIAAGYAGADFLEGAVKWLPKPPVR